jgi:hypothetical protein
MKEAALGFGLILAIGLSYLWFNGLLIKSTGMTDKELNQQLTEQSQRIFLDHASGNIIFIRDIGGTEVPVDSLSFYINNRQINATCSDSNITINNTVKCTLSEHCSGKRISVTSAGNHDSIDCA